ncbi:MAG: hypothetical protein M1834_000241 [Cirrosporium novae-zelandiae]|nr:MAG: hypothetical protein M1834_000241 [Cirrosporium novae-zelandiae]
MSSYLQNLLTTTTSRYNSIRRTLLSDESDGDTEDDSHISRVLRAYYTEKGRPFPPWLPPDPNAPQAPPTPQYAYAHSGSSMSQRSGAGRGLGDLFGDNPAASTSQQNLSLRTGRPGRGAGRALLGGPRPTPSSSSIVDSYHTTSSSGGDHQLQPPTNTSRPLPSQRAGSYQTTLAQQQSYRTAAPSPPPTAGSGGSAQERLKARLWGGRSASPTPSSGSGSGSLRGGNGQYERGNSFSGGRESPYIASGSPWVQGDEQQGGGRRGYGRR